MEALSRIFKELLSAGNWPSTIQFLHTTVPHRSLPAEYLDEFDSQITGCPCGDLSSHSLVPGSSESLSCADGSCQCSKNIECPYDPHGLLKPKYLTAGSDDYPPILECGDDCSCKLSGRCCNRVVGYLAELFDSLRYYPFETGASHVRFPLDLLDSLSIWKYLKIFQTERTGYGLKATVDIVPGQFISEYAGEVISSEEAARRSEEHSDDTYIFVIREKVSVKESLPILTCIDAREKGNWGRFINHSCDANVVMLPVRFNTIIPHLAFFARRRIPAGEELTVDYDQGFDHGRFTAIEDSHPEVVMDINQETKKTENSGFMQVKRRCLCGSGKCRRFLPFNSFVFARD